jgi:hypothetical protein
MLNRLLFTKMDNAPLIIFRVFFGLLVSLECYGAIVTGWVKSTLIDPEFTFTFIGFEWLQPLPGVGMYLYFFVMGTLGILMAMGYKYRFSAFAFLVLWTGVYLMQKSSYNNHYYLLILIAGFMAFFPANRSFSIDARQHPKLHTNAMYAYVKWIVVAQLFLVYTYAAIAKMYGDWLDFGIIKILMQSKADYYVIGGLLQHPVLHQFLGISGILFDLFIVPALLWKPTRKYAFIASIFFHLFNSIVFQIGIVFFFEPETIRRLFFKQKTPYVAAELALPSYKNGLLLVLGLYFLLQLLLPLRHHLIADDVLWTEEGHRMSWRMMLRSRAGTTDFYVVDQTSKQKTKVDLKAYLTPKQIRRINSYPDFIWQFAQRLKKEQSAAGKSVSVYVDAKVSINGKPLKRFIDPEVDMAKVPWDHFKHHPWILPSEKAASPKRKSIF